MFLSPDTHSNSKRATISNIKRGKYAFLSPFWDEVSEEAKVTTKRIEWDLFSKLNFISNNSYHALLGFCSSPAGCIPTQEVHGYSDATTSLDSK